MRGEEDGVKLREFIRYRPEGAMQCLSLSSTNMCCQKEAGHFGPHVDCDDRTWPNTAAEVVPGGANRDPHPERKPAHWFSVDRESVAAIAETHHEGDLCYGYENWTKGLPASNLANHAFEHLFALNSGDNSEPHLDHAIWNLGKLRWMAKHRPDMIDVPAYRRYFGLPPLEGK